MDSIHNSVYPFHMVESTGSVAVMKICVRGTVLTDHDIVNLYTLSTNLEALLGSTRRVHVSPQAGSTERKL